MNRLNFNHLYYFTIIAEQGSIVKASKRLNLTQPALSHQLRSLEEEFEEKLFDRVGKKLVINETGLMVLRYAKKIFRTADELKTSIRFSNKNQIKTINVAVLPWIPSEIITNAIKDHLMKPYLHFNIVQIEINEISKKLKSGEIDIVFTDAPYSGRSKSLREIRYLKDEVACISSPTYQINESLPKAIKEKSIITYSNRSRFASDLNSYLDDLSYNFNLIGQFSQIQMVIQAVTEQKCISFIPMETAKLLEEDDKIKVLGSLPKLKYEVWAITKSSLNRESIIREITEGPLA